MKTRLFILLMGLLSPTWIYSQLTLKENGRLGLGTDQPRREVDIITNGPYSDSVVFGKENVGDKLLIKLPISQKENGVEYSGVSVSPLSYPFSSNLGASNQRWGNIYLMRSPNVLSDIRFLTNVSDMPTDVADRLLQVKPVMANFRDTLLGYSLRGNSAEYKESVPVIVAQDLELVFPDLVEKENDVYGVRYAAMIPYLLQAIREQQEKIMTLNSETELLKKKVAILSKNETVGVIQATSQLIDVKLGQNEPNPFTTQSEIELYIPKTVTKAVLCVYDLNGTQLKSYRIAEKGSTYLLINKSDFRPGIFIYALICDDDLVDSKEMIILE